MPWEIGFLISLGFAGATAWVFVLSLMAQLVRPGMSWRLPVAAGALVANQLGTWSVQQFLHMAPLGMVVVDGVLMACAVAISRRPAQRWATSFAIIASLQFLLTAAYCVTGGSAYLPYVWATDATFAGLVVLIGVISSRIAFARRRAAPGRA